MKYRFLCFTLLSRLRFYISWSRCDRVPDRSLLRRPTQPSTALHATALTYRRNPSTGVGLLMIDKRCGVRQATRHNPHPPGPSLAHDLRPSQASCPSAPTTRSCMGNGHALATAPFRSFLLPFTPHPRHIFCRSPLLLAVIPTWDAHQVLVGSLSIAKGGRGRDTNWGPPAANNGSDPPNSTSAQYAPTGGDYSCR